MTYGTHYVIDEAGAFFQREPTVAESIGKDFKDS